MRLDDAQAIYIGSNAAKAVYIGTEQVWPTDGPAPGWGVFTGGTVTDLDGWRYHEFTDDGTLGVASPGRAEVLVADGGAGGGWAAGGGGGGGWVQEFTGDAAIEINEAQPVTVAAKSATPANGFPPVDGPGNPSSLGSLVTGFSAGQGGSNAAGDSGSTGGGGAAGPSGGSGLHYAGGTGALGGSGGSGRRGTAGVRAPGGGGGAGGNGGDSPGSGVTGAAGAGVQSVIASDLYETPTVLGAGGGGGTPTPANSGNGGPAGTAGSPGASGLVIVRTPTP